MIKLTQRQVSPQYCRLKFTTSNSTSADKIMNRCEIRLGLENMLKCQIWIRRAKISPHTFFHMSIYEHQNTVIFRLIEIAEFDVQLEVRLCL